MKELIQKPRISKIIPISPTEAHQPDISPNNLNFIMMSRLQMFNHNYNVQGYGGNWLNFTMLLIAFPPGQYLDPETRQQCPVSELRLGEAFGKGSKDETGRKIWR